jgi:tripartite-type tricarboxylate transporter receptor subunit TctC
MRRCIAWLVVALAANGPAVAQEPFFKSKTVRIVISTGVAGGYAEYARVLAEHLPRHLAGAPHIIVQSMPGAGGLLAANYLYTQAPQDGTTIGMVHSSVPLAPLWGNKAARFDTLKFNWLGALDRVDGMCIAWHDSPIKTWNDMLTREYTVGSSGSGSQMDTIPAILNKLFGTKIKVIAGYKDGTSVFIAMERGELDGRCGGQLTVIKSTRAWWLTEHKIRVPIMIAQARNPEFPDTPTIAEFVRDEPTRQQLDLIMLAQSLDRPVMLPPGVPADRVKEMRAAFDTTVADASFRADIERRSLHVDPVSGEEMAKAFARAFALPADIIAGAREMMGAK